MILGEPTIICLISPSFFCIVSKVSYLAVTIAKSILYLQFKQYIVFEKTKNQYSQTYNQFAAQARKTNAGYPY
jgi:hypothetical protein